MDSEEKGILDRETGKYKGTFGLWKRLAEVWGMGSRARGRQKDKL